MIQSGNCIQPAALTKAKAGLARRRLDTAELPLFSYTYVDRILTQSYIRMDPRRTRDPRLARAQAADPRLQRPASHSPAPPPPPPHSNYYNNGGPGPASASHTPTNSTPPQPFVQAGDTVVNQLQYTNAPAPSYLPGATETSEVTRYKQRPLFCVVCASNQVRSISCCALHMVKLSYTQNRSMEGHYILSCVFWFIFNLPS
jgi:hypothetical protein